MRNFNGRKMGVVLAASLAIGGVAFAGMGEGGDRGERRAKMLERFDTNRDGQLDEAERSQMKAARAEARFKKLDTDGNGSLSLEEFKQGAHMRGERGEHGKHGHRKPGR